MSDVLLTIETESTVTCAACSPTDSLSLCYCTILGDFAIRTLVPPEQVSGSELDSDFMDYENKYKPHSEVLLKTRLSGAGRQIRWECEEEKQTLYIALREELKVFDLATEEGKLVLKETASIAPEAGEISRILITEEHIILGMDTGDIQVFDKESRRQLAKMSDAADYISDMDWSSEYLLVTSGDGSLYVYDENFKKKDNNATEEFDFSAVAVRGDLALVGTSLSKILVYKIHNPALPVNQLRMPDEIEFITRYRHFFLVGLSNGQLHCVLSEPLKNAGIIASVQRKPLLFGAPNADESLFVVGGTDNKLYVLNFAWILEEDETNHAQTLKAGEHNGLQGGEAEQKPAQGAEELLSEADEEFEEKSDPEEIADKSSDDESTGSSEDSTKYINKTIKPGHIASDESFSDFFHFEKAEKSTKQKAKDASYGKAKTTAEKKEFFGDL